MTFGQLADNVIDIPLKDALTAMQELKDRQTDDPAEPLQLPLKSVELVPNVFQVRGADVEEHHVGSLMALLKGGRALDPITVWRCGRHALLVDGHHRLRAYRRFQRTHDRPVEIPVRWFHGSAEAAMKEAAASNVKINLQMTPDQRADLAWRLTLSGGFSRADTASTASVSTGLVAAMRKAQKALGEDAGNHETWWKARKASQGLGPELSDDELEAKLALQVEQWAGAMAKTFSTKLANNPTVAARVLERYFGRRSRQVIKLWLEEMGDDDGIFETDTDDVVAPF